MSPLSFAASVRGGTLSRVQKSSQSSLRPGLGRRLMAPVTSVSKCSSSAANNMETSYFSNAKLKGDGKKRNMDIVLCFLQGYHFLRTLALR